MENKKLDEDKSMHFDNENIDEYIDSQINEQIRKFSINEYEVDLVHVPSDLKKSINTPFKYEKKEKRRNIRYTILDIIIVCLVLLPVVGVVNPNIFEKVPAVYPIFKNINKAVQIDNIKSILGISDKDEIIEGSADSSVNTVFIKEKDIHKPKNNNDAIKLIHSLANTLIEADYKWECSEVTPKTVKIALEGVEKIDDAYDRMHLRNCIRKWSKGDFSNAVSVHNYVWEMLGGNVGKAEALDNEAINNVLEKYYQSKE